MIAPLLSTIEIVICPVNFPRRSLWALTATERVALLPLVLPEGVGSSNQLRLPESTVACHATGSRQFPANCRVIFCAAGSGCNTEEVNERLVGVTCTEPGWSTTSLTETTCAPS